MPLRAPDLDDRHFPEIVAEARALIPRYAPEWTGHNESDPGIALLRLFSWMTESLIFRLNQVPERNYVKFLQLLGIELMPARPARAELTFSLARDDLDFVVVPRGTRVAVAGGGDPPIVFETDRSLIALGAKLKAVVTYDGFAYSNETMKNDPAVAQSFAPFGPKAREGGALHLGFALPPALQFTAQQLDFAVAVHSRPSESWHCDIDLSAMPVGTVVVWEYWDWRTSSWEGLVLDRDDTRAMTRSGHVLLRGPGERAGRRRLGESAEELFWIRARLERNDYDTPPQLEFVLMNTVLATQALTVRDEVVGGSDGRPDQSFQLRNLPAVVRDEAEVVKRADGRVVKVRSVRLEVDEGQGRGFEVWEEVDDFYHSTEADPHFTLNRNSGQVRFGNGEHGRIPQVHPTDPNRNIVAREYRFGGGKAGNVGARRITELQSFVESAKGVTNERPSYGGDDEETVDEAKRRAPAELKSRGRAVTAEDFELLAKATPGAHVKRAKALPLAHPKFKGAQIPGTVSVIVVPDGDSPNPSPSETTMRLVCAHLDGHRLLTTEVHVMPPNYRRVRIEGDIVARPEADLAQVKRSVETNLDRFFHPLRGGLDGTGWPFGQDISYSDVCRTVVLSDGVDRIENGALTIWLDAEAQAFCRDVPLDSDVLLYSDGHDIRVAYRARR